MKKYISVCPETLPQNIPALKAQLHSRISASTEKTLVALLEALRPDFESCSQFLLGLPESERQAFSSELATVICDKFVRQNNTDKSLTGKIDRKIKKQLEDLPIESIEHHLSCAKSAREVQVTTYAEALRYQNLHVEQALTAIMGMQVGEKRQGLLTQFRADFVACGKSCCTYVLDALKTDRNRAILTSMYIEACFYAPHVKQTIEDRQVRLLDEANENRERAKQRAAYKIEQQVNQLFSGPSEKQSATPLPEGSNGGAASVANTAPSLVTTLNTGAVTSTATSLVTAEPVATIQTYQGQPSPLTVLSEDLHQRFSQGYQKNLKDYVNEKRRPENNVPTQSESQTIAKICEGLASKPSRALQTWANASGKERKEQLNAFLENLHLPADRRHRHLVKWAISEMVGSDHQAVTAFKTRVAEVIDRHCSVALGTVSIPLTVHQAYDLLFSVGYASLNPEAQSRMGQSILGNLFKNDLAKNKVSSASKVVSYGKLDANNQTQAVYNLQKDKNQVVIGFVLQTLGIDRGSSYHAKHVEAVLRSRIHA